MGSTNNMVCATDCVTAVLPLGSLVVVGEGKWEGTLVWLTAGVLCVVL